MRPTLASVLCWMTIATGAASAQAPSPEAIKDLAPSGRLRAAINLGNGVLAQGTAQAPSGLSVDLARELAKRSGLPLDLVTFEAAGKVFDALKTNAWDVAFMAHEPRRAAPTRSSSPPLTSRSRAPTWC